MLRYGVFVVAILASIVIVSARWLQPSDDEIFEELLANKIKENEQRDGSVHGHIVAVNEASNWMSKKGINGDIPLTEEIESANEAEKLDLFEGDILPGNYPQDESESVSGKRNIVKTSAKIWPSTAVPYYVAPELGHLRGMINSAIREFNTRTCVHFREVADSYSGDHIRLVGGGGCGSHVGRRGGGQNVYLGRGCEYVGVIVHEMMHALGVWHEQSRPDRDKHVEILWHNIEQGKQKNFRKYGHGQLDNLNLPYDTSSIMHYDRFLFSKNKKPTIIARGLPWKSLGGQLRGTMTSNDVRELNSLFNC